MPRRLPKPRHLLLTLALLLSLTSATLWLRSLWYRTNLIWYATPLYADSVTDSTDVEFNNGLLHFQTTRHSYFGPHTHWFQLLDRSLAAEEYNRSHWQWTPTGRGWSFAGFAHISSGGTSSARQTTTTVPLYFPTLLFSLYPALRLRSHLRRRHRSTHNLCQSCGYDLRASPEKCPECGAVPASSVSSTFSVRS